MCLPPATAKFTAVLKVAAGAGGEGLGVKPGLVLDPDSKIVIEASIEPDPARPGETVTLVLDVTVDERYHAYGTKETTNLPVALDPAKLQAGGLEILGAAKIPPGERKEQFGLESWPLPHRFRVEQALRVPLGTAPSTIEVKGLLDYQLCDENSCDSPEEGAFTASVKVESGQAREAVPQAVPQAGPRDDGSPFGGSWWALIFACIGGGLFALAMPCTYPMIPITFSFFTKQAEKRGGKVMSLAVVYGLGIIAMFVLVGVSLSAVIIDVVNHWVTNTVIGVLFFFFAFVLFGWINLNPPQFVQRAAGKASTTGGLLGVFFMGATLVITSFTCTAPIVGSLIANVAKYGTARVGIGMGIFGLTMALPFVVLALMPTRVKSMPRSGEWMETLKVSLGFVELAAAFKFVSMVDFAFGWQVLPRELFLMLWAAIFGLWALYLFGILRKAGTANEGVGSGRMAGGMFVTLLAAYFLFGALGNRLDSLMTSFVPNYSNSLIASAGGKSEQPKAKHTVVYDDPDQALAKARSEGKLLLYNFTGFN
jgi:thiol:disulfide interchange protein DsbD